MAGEPMLTVRQRVLVAVGIAVFAVLAFVVLPRLRSGSTEDRSEPKQRTYLRGRIEGVPEGSGEAARAIVSLDRWGLVTSGEPFTLKVPAVAAQVDIDGTYEADISKMCGTRVGEGVVRVSVDHPLCAPTDFHVRVQFPEWDGSSREIRLDAVLQPAVRITGQVEGQGRDSAFANLYDLTEALGVASEAEIPRFEGATVRVDTALAVDSTGAFRLRGVRGHLLVVVVHAPGRLPNHRIFPGSDEGLADMGAFVLEAGVSIEGKVVSPDGLAVSSVFAEVPTPPGALSLGSSFFLTSGGLVSAATGAPVDEAGRFRLGGLQPGLVTLTPGLRVPAQDEDMIVGPLAESARRHVTAPATDVRLEILESRLLVEATDAEGRESEGVIELVMEGKRQGTLHVEGSLGVRVPVAMPFRLVPVDGFPKFDPVEGRTADAGGTRTVSIEVVPIPEPGKVRLVLEPRVGIPRCEVTWKRDGAAPPHGSVYRRLKQFVDGDARIDRLPPGRYEFRVVPLRGGEGTDGWWVARPVEVDIRSGEEALATVPLEEGGRWKVSVTRADTGAFQRCDVDLLLAGGDRAIPLLTYDGPQRESYHAGSRVEVGNPNRAIDPLPAGTYELRFAQPGFRTETRALVIKPRETTRLEVALEPK